MKTSTLIWEIFLILATRPFLWGIHLLCEDNIPPVIHQPLRSRTPPLPTATSMPFFENASKFSINGGKFNDIAGNQHISENSHNNNQTNSNNTNTYTATNSYNNSSRRTDRSRNTRHINSGTVSHVHGTSANVHYGDVNPQSVHTIPPNPLIPEQASNPAIPYHPAMPDSHNPPQMLTDTPSTNSNNPFRQQQQLPNPLSREQSDPLPAAKNPIRQGNYPNPQQQYALQHPSVPHYQSTPASTVDQTGNVSQLNDRRTRA